MRLVLDVTSFQKALMGNGSRHVFDQTGGVIGRARRSDWVLPDPDRFVSGTHAEISFDGERFYITDVSTNGLFLNDSSVPLGKGARWPISNGDRMAVGDFEIVARVEEDADTALPSARPASPAFSQAPTPPGDRYRQPDRPRAERILRERRRCTTRMGTKGTRADVPGLALPAPSEPDPEPEHDAQHPLIDAWARQSLPDLRPCADDVRQFVQCLHRDFVFDRTATTRNTTLLDFFTGCRGVCEDYARLAAACLRVRGVPVRHVVGYLLPAEGRQANFGRHAHAWISTWFQGTGWIDFDPTTGLTVPDRHVTLVRGFGRDDTLPVSGRFTDGQTVGQRVSVDVSIVNA